MSEITRSPVLRAVAVLATGVYVVGFAVALVKRPEAVPIEQLLTFVLCVGTPAAFAEAHAGATGLRRTALGVLALLSSLCLLVLGGVLPWLALGGSS